MGGKQSIYEKVEASNYIKLSREERHIVKLVWSEIEKNPQFHGHCFFRGLCGNYPKYSKYFTLNPHGSINFESRAIAKFTLITEALVYIFLDYTDKPKQLDKFVGYIAMVHKDMKLDGLDMAIFGSSLLQYLQHTFPIRMTQTCHETIQKLLNNILEQTVHKMKLFSKHEASMSIEEYLQQHTYCPSNVFCGEPRIFGKPAAHWIMKREEWNRRIETWKNEYIGVLEAAEDSSTDDEDTSDASLLDWKGTFENKDGISDPSERPVAELYGVKSVNVSKPQSSKTNESRPDEPSKSQSSKGHTARERRRKTRDRS
ncbi:uncharacterized protein [Prorops nasuta]|uniref:uncharacterized protein isoform X2 n=1 Tax=Prorops nasuta TaxID=863751 RepID=UPI0034CE5F84